MGVIRGICTSDRKGIQKTEVGEATLIEDWGIEGDAMPANGTGRSACWAWGKSRHSAPGAQKWNLAPSVKT